VRERVNIYSVGTLVSLISDINTLLCGYQVYQLVAILADNHRPSMTGHIVPLNAIPILVVVHRQAGLVVELLEPLDGDPDVVVGLYGALLDTLVIVRLGFSCFSSRTPESLWVRLVGGWYSVIISASPEPAINIDRLQVSSVTTLVLEITFSATGIDGGHVISSHDLLKHFELPWSVERDKVHTAVTAEISSIEPVPVLKLVPRLPPGQKVVVVPNLHVSFSFHAFIHIRSVEQRFSIRAYPGRFLAQTCP